MLLRSEEMSVGGGRVAPSAPQLSCSITVWGGGDGLAGLAACILRLSVLITASSDASYSHLGPAPPILPPPPTSLFHITSPTQTASFILPPQIHPEFLSYYLLYPTQPPHPPDVFSCPLTLFFITSPIHNCLIISTSPHSPFAFFFVFSFSKSKLEMLPLPSPTLITLLVCQSLVSSPLSHTF